MRPVNNVDVSDAAAKTMCWALAVLLLTTVHHVYGAYIYDTPWRNHAAAVAALTAAALAASHRVLARRPGTTAGGVAFWAFAAVTLAVPVVLIGLFEGGYNHAVKDALYFAGASGGLMRRLFPPPTYEMPDDAFFEVTGVLQLALGIITGLRLLDAVRARRR